jgi:hypothetical protein
MSGTSGTRATTAVSNEADSSRFPLLETIQCEGTTWEELAPRYGVTSPVPPWKTSLDAMCECLAVGGALPTLERRHSEDQLGETLYNATPAPERQLLALVHMLLSRGLVEERDLARHINTVRSRFETP